MTTFFTSDLHLGHANILPTREMFKDIVEHDECLIRRWNAKVKEDDEVYILGDLSFRSPHHISHYITRMKGRKHLIVGNHDDFWMQNVEDMSDFFESVDNLKTIKLEKRKITLCHYPMLEWYGSRVEDSDEYYLIHGHIHGLKVLEVYGHIKKCLPHALNASVDVNNFEPVTFEELKKNCEVWYERKS